MCLACRETAPDRRKFLALSAASVAATWLLSARLASAADATTSVTADEALAKLKAGNEKYVGAPQICAADLLAQRGQVPKGRRRGRPF